MSCLSGLTQARSSETHREFREGTPDRVVAGGAWSWSGILTRFYAAAAACNPDTSARNRKIASIHQGMLIVQQVVECSGARGMRRSPRPQIVRSMDRTTPRGVPCSS